ncbi:MAG: hypothetical protein RI928_2147 [Pseudomonadota bacterium]|jgi:hypothetical protein
MNIVQRKLLIAVIALFCSAGAAANDPPKEAPKDAKAGDHKDDKKDGKDAKDAKDAKADAPAEPELPSKPYPTNVTPKAFQPKKDAAPKADAGHDKPADKADKAGDKPGDKTAAKPGADKPADKHAAEKPSDKAGDAHATPAPKHDSAPHKVVKKHHAGHNAHAKTPQPTPAMVELAREVAAQQKNTNAQSYVVQARDNLDSVIRKTMPANLFAADVLRQAYFRANPALVNNANVKLRQGQVLQVPDVATVRAVVMSDSGNSHGNDSKISLHSTAPVVAPTVAPTANDLNPPIAIPRLPVNVAGSANPAPEVSPEEKKKWVRYP